MHFLLPVFSMGVVFTWPEVYLPDSLYRQQGETGAAGADSSHPEAGTLNRSVALCPESSHFLCSVDGVWAGTQELSQAASCPADI